MNDYIYGIEPNRCMAQIVRVDGLSIIEGMQNIELAYVLGWQCIVKKNDFKVGDLAIYFCIDSILDPNHPNFKFLAGKRLKTKKMFDTLSQGLLGPLTWLTDYDNSIDLSKIKLGDDVTNILRVKKYIVTSELQQYSQQRNYPNFVPKTDEEPIQNTPKILNELINRDVVITRKEDGTSTTFVYCNFIHKSPYDIYDHNSNFLICDRNKILSNNDPIDLKSASHYFEINNKFKIEEKMKRLGRNIAIQGEIVGPKINKNKLKLETNDFRVFNIWDIDHQQYLNWENVEDITNKLQLNRVPVVYKGKFKKEMATIPALLKMAEDLEYVKNVPAEGLVVKTNSGDNRYSFKVVSNKYLIKNNK